MLRVLIAKDLRRAWRNPLPWMINLIVPLAITALIGIVFGGGGSSSPALGRIRFAFVDEDKSALSEFLRGAAGRGDGAQYLDPVVLDREAAMREINANKLSAVLIIPEHFMRDYFNGGAPVSLELIKNPAQSVHPAVLEEMLGVVVTLMNGIERNFRSEFPAWYSIIGGKIDFHALSRLIEETGEKVRAAGKYLNPPLVNFEKEVRPEEAKSGPAFNLFAYLLAGMVAMFLLFLANTAMSDLHTELRLRTFERYHTLQDRLLPFVAAKFLFAVVLLLFCNAIMLGGGGLLFHIQWEQPLALISLVIGYTCFAAALMGMFAAIITDERRAAVLQNVVGMGLALAGGCMFPVQSLPAFLRNHVSPLLPTYWFSDTVRNLVIGVPNVPWARVSLELAAVSLVMLVIAATLFRRRFKTGLR